MANYDGDGLDRQSRPRRHTRGPSPGGEHDWRPPGETSHHSSPPRASRRREIQSSERTTPSLRPGRTSWSSPANVATMPLLRRSSTEQYRRGKDPYAYVPYEVESPSGSHRSSRRDGSPRSTRRYRSTPESRRSSRTSASESDGGSEITVSTQDERPDRHEKRERHGHHAATEDHRREPDDKRRRRRRRRETVIYEEDKERDHDSRHSLDERASPSRRESRHSSRHSSDRHDSGSSVRKSHRRRHSYIEDDKPPNSSATRRVSRRAHPQDVVYAETRPIVRRSHTTSGGSQVTSHSASSSTKRSSAFLGGFFGPAMQPYSVEKPVKQAECVVCMDDLPASKTAKLKCGHRMCNTCLKRSFKLSITDPQHMPPKCCTTDHIPLKHVDRLFSLDFKKTWNKKFAEYSTRNRIYCPAKRCGEWIKPENIHREDGRKYAKCGRCKTKVCGMCNGKWHTSRDCPKDEETNKLLEQAKKEGWQRCFKCRTVVELKEGCNHMTCRCGAEFCMICGTKWKSCECPWFNYDAVENDRLQHMQIPTPLRMDRFDRLDMDPPSPRGFRPGPGPGPAPAAVRPRPQNYEDEMLLRRLQEQRDEDLARRLQSFDRGEDDDYQGRVGDVTGIGNSGGHFMNDNYRRRPQNIPVPQVPPPPPGFDRANTGGDYVSGVNRARGVRGESMERLADRFSETRHSPGRRPGGMMPPPPHGGPLPMGMGPPGMGPPGMGPPPPPPHGPILRRHTMEEEMYNNARATRPSERVVPGRMRHDYAAEAAVHAPNSRRQHVLEEPKSSTLAGLTGPGRGMNRVFEWRNHVEPGEPAVEATEGAKA